MIIDMFRFSHLRQRVLDTCRLRYRYQYVDRIPARLRPQDTAGTLVHNVLSEFFARVPREERTPGRLIQMFEQRWDALSPRYRRMPGVESLRERSREQLRRFAGQRDLQAAPFMIEAYFQVRIAPDVLLFGRMDRIDEEPDGSLHIIDYKTGAQPEEIDARQLQLYAIMVEQKLERPVSRASFWYLDDGSTWTMELSGEEKKRALEQAVAAAREMQTLSEFPPNVGRHCAHCPYLYACEMRAEIAERRESEGW